jgi:hypothetical protein
LLLISKLLPPLLLFPPLPLLQALLDQRQSGKQLLLITNSDYHYTHRMMSFAYDCFLPEGQTWRDLFDMVSGCGIWGVGSWCACLGWWQGQGQGWQGQGQGMQGADLEGPRRHGERVWGVWW